MHFVLSDGWIDGLRAALLIAAFAGFAWALLRTRRQAEQAHAQVAARLDTTLVEIRRLSGQLIALGGSIESLETSVVRAQAQAQAHSASEGPDTGPASGPIRGQREHARLRNRDPHGAQRRQRR